MKELDAIEQADAGRALGEGLAAMLALPGASRDQQTYPQQELRETWARDVGAGRACTQRCRLHDREEGVTPIDSGTGAPYPAPPAGWEPAHLTADIEAALDRAWRDRVDRVAAARGITVRQAAVVVCAEIREAL